MDVSQKKVGKTQCHMISHAKTCKNNLPIGHKRAQATIKIPCKRDRVDRNLQCEVSFLAPQALGGWGGGGAMCKVTRASSFYASSAPLVLVPLLTFCQMANLNTVKGSRRVQAQLKRHSQAHTNCHTAGLNL